MCEREKEELDGGGGGGRDVEGAKIKVLNFLFYLRMIIIFLVLFTFEE